MEVFKCTFKGLKKESILPIHPWSSALNAATLHCWSIFQGLAYKSRPDKELAGSKSGGNLGPTTLNYSIKKTNKQEFLGVFLRCKYSTNLTQPEIQMILHVFAHATEWDWIIKKEKMLSNAQRSETNPNSHDAQTAFHMQ